VGSYIPEGYYRAQAHGKTQGRFQKNEFVYDQQRDLYICPQGEELVFSHLQKRDGRQLLLIYQGKNYRRCRFFGQCKTNKNERTPARHRYDEQLKQMFGFSIA